MAYQDILVYVNEDDEGFSAIDAALALGERHDAHVTGIYVLFIPPIPGYVKGQLGAEILDRQREHYVERARAAEAEFTRRAQASGVRFAWHCVEGPPTRVLPISARYFDLLVMGRQESHIGDSGVGVVEACVLETGKPVIVMPGDGPAKTPGRHVMAAWNGAREAARAIDAALPLLVTAERVDVVAIDALESGYGDHSDIPGADLGAHLARHGVKVEVENMDSDGDSVGEALLARATADGVDLLVMGAYGHARWREVVLGGATAYVLRHARMPVLMAH